MEWAHKTLDWITDRTLDVTIWLFNRSPFWLPYWQKLCCWTTGPAISTIRSILPERPKPVEVDYGDIEWGNDGPYEGQPTMVECTQTSAYLGFLSPGSYLRGCSDVQTTGLD